MTTTKTVQAAVKEQDNSPSGLIEKYSTDFARVLPSHIKPETWVRLAQGVLQRDPKVAEAATANPGSFLNALLEAARQGLEPGTEQYYLTPRKNKGRPTVVGIRGYQGEIELIYRAGAVSSVIVEVVREADTFQYRQGRDDRPVHDVDWFAEDRGPLVGVYAYAVMKDGALSKVVVLNKTHIERAKQASEGSSSEHSPWVRDEEAMWLKTAVHRLQKWVPTSAEYRREQLRAVAEAQATASRLPDDGPSDMPVDDTVDGEVIDDDVPAGVDAQTGEVTDGKVTA